MEKSRSKTQSIAIGTTPFGVRMIKLWIF